MTTGGIALKANSASAYPVPLRCPASDSFSPNPAVNQTIEWLREHGYPPLPIAPFQSPERYPKPNPHRKPDQPPDPLFTDKNPSWLDCRGCPHLLGHQPYHRDRLPCLEDLKRWFAHPDTGIGTLGGWQDTYWLDIDAHHYPSVCVCQQVVEAYLEFAGLQQTFIEQTQRGGSRIGVRLREPPDYSTMSFALGGRQIGELLGQGMVTVLAPTLGQIGQYRSIVRSTPLWVKSLPSISIFSHRSTATAPPIVFRPQLNGYTSQYDRLLCRRVRGLINRLASVQVGERSDVLSRIAREVYGWQNYAAQRGVLLPNADGYLLSIGTQLGLDEARIGRILGSCSYGVPIRDSMPAAHYYGGSAVCDRILRRVAR